ncbi:hypothetical protein ACFVZH_08135 [Streptomyces sp. NPDC059534]|uniref:hypothetical protein n=1 Tax=Streptomyces sp. NPDC059534 TaxID=3346859 RepID=UPI003693BA53
MVELTIRNVGRRDVEASHFSTGNGESLVFDFGTEIISVLGVQYEPSTSNGATAGISAADPGKLHIGPALIPQKAKVTYTLLVDGPRRDVQLRTALLTQTPVKVDEPGPFQKKVLARLAPLIATVMVTGGGVLAGLWGNNAADLDKGVHSGPAVSGPQEKDATPANCRQWQRDEAMQPTFIRLCIPFPEATQKP